MKKQGRRAQVKRLFSAADTAARAEAKRLANLHKKNEKLNITTVLKTDSEGREYRVREWDGKLIPIAKVSMEDIRRTVE